MYIVVIHDRKTTDYRITIHSRIKEFPSETNGSQVSLFQIMMHLDYSGFPQIFVEGEHNRSALRNIIHIS